MWALQQIDGCCAQDLAQGRASQQKLIDAAAAAATGPAHSAAAEQRRASLPAMLNQVRGSAENGAQNADSTGATETDRQVAAGAEPELEAEEQAEDSEDDEELGSISSGEESDGDEEDGASEDDEEDVDVDEHTEAASAAAAGGIAAAAGQSSHEPVAAHNQEEHAGELDPDYPPTSCCSATYHTSHLKGLRCHGLASRGVQDRGRLAARHSHRPCPDLFWLSAQRLAARTIHTGGLGTPF